MSGIVGILVYQQERPTPRLPMKKITNRPDRTTSSIQKGNARTAAINAGAYDGRFATRAVPNKRAHANRNACRGKVSF